MYLDVWFHPNLSVSCIIYIVLALYRSTVPQMAKLVDKVCHIILFAIIGIIVDALL